VYGKQAFPPLLSEKLSMEEVKFENPREVCARTGVERLR
jgi:hypothetical protein